MADIFEKMWTLGVPSSDMKDITLVKPFRVSTVGERLLMRAAMENIFDIPETGFVENPWGFPYLPLPQKRSVSTEGFVIAPDSISFEGLGHPIFWIDPSLTRRTQEEKDHPEQWAVRMFYLMMSLGVLDTESLRWINVPRAQGVNYGREEWLAYKQGTSSDLDAVRPLNEGDLIEPLETVLRNSRIALGRCAEAQTQVWSQYRAELNAAYTTAVSSTRGKSEWDDLENRIKETIGRIAEASERGVVPASLVPDVYSQLDELERIVQHTERCALLLSIPVINTNGGDGDRASAAATAIGVMKAEVDVSADSLRTEAHRLFALNSDSKPQEFVRLHELATSIYIKSWRTLMVSARNLVKMAEGGSVYQSWEAFELVENVGTVQWPPLSEVMAGIGRN